jgi:hypothetical protein
MSHLDYYFEDMIEPGIPLPQPMDTLYDKYKYNKYSVLYHNDDMQDKTNNDNKSHNILTIYKILVSINYLSN